jgi:hypothetical protein
MRRQFLLFSLLVVPSIVFAQKSQAGPKAAKAMDLDTSRVPQGPTLRVRDVEDQSPLKLFADKHKDLKLTDAQTDAMKSADKALREKNALSYKAVDSLIGVMRSANRSDADRGRSRLARAGIMLAIGDITTNNDAAAKEQMATFTPEQQAKATELLGKQAEDGKKMLRDRLGGGGI